MSIDDATAYLQLVAVNQIMMKAKSKLQEWISKGDFSGESLKMIGLYGASRHPSEEYQTDLEIMCTIIERQMDDMNDLVEQAVAQAISNADPLV